MCLILVVLGAACTGQNGTASPSADPATPCGTIVKGCEARRDPDIVLRAGATDGGLQSVDGLSLTGIISADKALKRAWDASSHSDAASVRVILGSAEPARVGWGPDTEKGLYYAVRWGGLCVPASVPPEASGSPSTCGSTEWGTIIDARSGSFIVDGV